jgi:hypothetical protein
MPERVPTSARRCRFRQYTTSPCGFARALSSRSLSKQHLNYFRSISLSIPTSTARRTLSSSQSISSSAKVRLCG